MRRSDPSDRQRVSYVFDHHRALRSLIDCASAEPIPVHTTTLLEGQIGLHDVLSNASLNHSMNHYDIAAGRCITFDTIRPGVSTARPRRAP